MNGSFIRAGFFVAFTVMAAATVARAQSISGTASDDSGAVLPGVTVEASSPALIEKVRTTVTDESGRYRIVSLSPGTYTVTFSLPGFGTAKRDGIELPTNFTATVNIVLSVGAIQETVNVSGTSPMVDVESTTKQTVITREIVDALPTARNLQSLASILPGVTTNSSGMAGGGRDVGGNTSLQQPSVLYRGNNNNIQLWDGYRMANAGGLSGAAVSIYPNDAAIQEQVFTTGTDSILVLTPAIQISLIPKDGGNTFHGLFFADYSHEPWNANNMSERLIGRGLQSVPTTYLVADMNGGVGGPIVKDTLWFYEAFRKQPVDLSITDIFYDADPGPLYKADLTRPAHDNGHLYNNSLRLTWQVSSKDKIAAWNTVQDKVRHNYFTTNGGTPDALPIQLTPKATNSTIRWTRIQSSKLLLEAGLGQSLQGFSVDPHPNVTPDMLAMTDLATGLAWNASPNGYGKISGPNHLYNGKVAATYATGSRELLVGMMLGRNRFPADLRRNGDVILNFNSGNPQSVTLRLPYRTSNSYFPDLGLFAQQRFTIGRATLMGGLRYDYFVSRVDDGTLPAGRWNPSQFFEGFTVVRFKDLSPRLGVAYDLFGNGKTAIKANVGRYIELEGTTTANNVNPQVTVGQTDTRTWNDLNGDYTIYNRDGSVQLAELGPTGNANFGKVIPSTTTQDPATRNGWNHRPSTVEFQTGVQHQLTSQLALDGTYYFRYLGNQLATQNTLISAADFTGPFCITAPASPLLPGGGGYPVCDLYDITARARPLVQNNVTFARNFGDGITNQYMGYNVGMTARVRAGTFFNAGLNGERRVYDTCDTPIPTGTNVPSVGSPEAQFCHQVTPFRPDVKIIGSHTLPGNFMLSGTFQFTSGPNITATWNAPNSIIAPALGRNLSAGATAVKAIQLIQPGTVYEAYLRQVDLRLSKRFAVGRYRLRGDVNLYNVFNADYINAINTAFSTASTSQYRRPTSVLSGRLFKIGGQIDF
jgi:hypothetical protein